MAQNSDADWASLYEQSFTGMTKYQVGQPVESRVVSISKDTVFLELNGKNEGLVAREELTDKDGNLKVQVGDSLKAYFLGSESGEMKFTTRIAGEVAGLDLLERAHQERIPVEGVVDKEIKGGYEVKIGEHRAFCPYSQMGAKRTENSAEYVGRNLTFLIQELKDNGRKIVVSNRAIHEAARQAHLDELKKSLKEGARVKGTVVSIQSYGAFVEVQGVQALLPISEFGRARIDDLSKFLQPGQEIEAVILKLDWQNEKISLSTKSLEADPWDQAVAKYPEGSKHLGRVARVTTFGAFVALEPGLDGLVHVSEFRNDSRFGDHAEVTAKVGDKLSVQVLSVDKANRRIALKPAASKEEDETAAKYLGGSSEGDTYNPFAALLKKK